MSLLNLNPRMVKARLPSLTFNACPIDACFVGVATCKHQSLEHKSLEHVYRHVYIDYPLKMVAWMGFYEAVVNVAFNLRAKSSRERCWVQRAKC